MNDRQLLELAARAAGLEYDGESHGESRWFDCERGRMHGRWEPLVDDSDALELAHKLGLEICCHGMGIYAKTVDGEKPDAYASQPESKNFDDGMTQIRRAIVRTAAKIGQQKR